MSFFKTLLASMLGFFASLLLIFVIGVAVVIAIIGSAGKSDTAVASPSVLTINLGSALPEYSDTNPFSQLSSVGTVTVRTF